MKASITRLLNELVQTLSHQNIVRGIILVGSYARGDNRDNSDVNVIILADDPQEFFKKIEFFKHFGNIFSVENSRKGILSFKIACHEDTEIQLSIVPCIWAQAEPIDPETLKVILNGVSILWDPRGQLEKLINLCQKQAHSKFLSNWNKNNKGSMLILLGISTSGKTTLINCMRTLDAKLLDFSIDLCFENKKGDIIKEIDLDNYQTLTAVLKHSEIAKIIEKNDKVKYKSSVTNSHKIQVENAIANLQKQIKKIYNLMPDDMFDIIFNSIVSAANSGKTLIFDVVYPEVLYRYLFNKIVTSSVKIALVYCPLLELSNRLNERNNSALASQKPSEYRRSFPLFQYIKLYKKKELPEEPILEVLTRDDAEKVFDEQIDDSDRHRKREFLELLGFSDNNIKTVEITTRFKFYDYILDTSKLSIKQAIALMLANQAS